MTNNPIGVMVDMMMQTLYQMKCVVYVEEEQIYVAPYQQYVLMKVHVMLVKKAIVFSQQKDLTKIVMEILYVTILAFMLTTVHGDDENPGSDFSLCDLGTDCSDCTTVVTSDQNACMILVPGSYGCSGGYDTADSWDLIVMVMSQ